MSDIELVIKIPEGTKEQIIALTNIGESFSPKLQERIVRAIINGTPLPENHGRIVDLDTVTVEEDTNKGVLWLDAPTILEASYGK